MVGTKRAANQYFKKKFFFFFFFLEAFELNPVWSEKEKEERKKGGKRRRKKGLGVGVRGKATDHSLFTN